MSHVRTLFSLFVLLAIVFSLVGCSASAPPPSMAGKWTLEEIDFKPLHAGVSESEKMMEVSEDSVYSSTRHGEFRIAGHEPYAYTAMAQGEIDLRHNSVLRRGIYTVRGDELVIAVVERAIEKNQRPLSFIPTDTEAVKIVVRKFKRVS